MVGEWRDILVIKLMTNDVQTDTHTAYKHTHTHNTAKTTIIVLLI